MLSKQKRNFLTSIIALFTASANGFFSIFFASKFLTISDLGLWTACQSAIGILLLLDLGVSFSLGRIFANTLFAPSRTDIQHSFSSAFFLLCLQSLFILLIGILGSYIFIKCLNLNNNDQNSLLKIWFIILLAQCTVFPIRASHGILHAANELVTVNLASSISQFIGFTINLILLLSNFGILSLAYGFCTTLFVQNAIIFLKHKKMYKYVSFSPQKINFLEIKKIFNYSLSIFILTATSQFIISMQNLIIARQISLEACAAFNYTIRIFTYAQQIVMAAFESIIPKWRRLFIDGFIYDINLDFYKKTLIIFCFTTIFFAFCFLFNPIFVEKWTGPQYFLGNKISGLCGLLILTKILIYSLTIPFNIYMRISKISTGLAILGLSEVFLSFYFAKDFGIVGILTVSVILNFCFGITFISFRFVYDGLITDFIKIKPFSDNDKNK